MQKPLLKKGIAVTVIVLFIATTIFPLVGSLSIEKHFSTGDVLLDSISILNNDPYYPVFNGTVGEIGFFISPVNVSFVYDPEAVAKIYYSYNASGDQQYTEPFVIYEQGEIIFEWYWFDYEGEESSHHTLTLFIDLYSTLYRRC